MRRLKLSALALLVALSVSPMQAAGTVVVTTKAFGSTTGVGKFIQYTVAWTATAGGAVSGNAFAIQAGKLVSIRFIPGTVTPTALYDVTMVDIGGTVSSGDLLSGAGADLSATTSTIKTFDPPIFEDGTRTIDVIVANAGTSTTGTVVLLVQIS